MLTALTTLSGPRLDSRLGSFGWTGALMGVVLCSAMGCPKPVEPPEASADPMAGTADWAGRYRVEISTPGGAIPFLLDVQGERAVIEAGRERIVAAVTRPGNKVVVAAPQYDARLELTRTATGLRGQYVTRRRSGEVALPLVGAPVEGAAHPFVAVAKVADHPLAGRYRMTFSSAPDDVAVGIFELTAGRVRGTILTDTGDYRHGYGTWDGEQAVWAVFDFAHAFLFRATRDTDGTLRGDFYSGGHWHDTFIAVADEAVKLDDGFSLSTVTTAQARVEGVFTGLDGKPVRYADLPPGPRVIEAFGTWCPNCNDATELLVALAREFKPRGVQVLGLGFELSGDAGKDLAALKKYQAHHKIPYPLLLADVVDKAENSKRFPFLDKIRAYPTTIFIDAEGKVRAVHSGFSGPATGDVYVQLKKKFRAAFEDLADASGSLPKR